MDSKDRLTPSVPAIPSRGAVPRTLSLNVQPPGPSAESATSRPSINIMRVAIRTISRHWWQILGLWALGTGGLAYAINTYIKPQYSAVSILRVEPSHRDLFGTGGGGESFEPYLETQVQLITSPNVLGAALVEPRTAALKLVREAGDAEGEVRSRLLVTLQPRSYLIKVAMTSGSAIEASTVVNSVVEAYLKAAAEWSDGMTRNQIKNLEAYQRELQNQADEKEQAWLDLASKGNVEISESLTAGQQGGTSLPMAKRSQLTIEEYKKVRDELLRVSFELTQGEAVLTMREAEAKNLEAQPKAFQHQQQARVETSLKNDPEVAALLPLIEDARSKWEGVKRLSRNQSDPAVVRALQRYKLMQARYKELVEEKRRSALAPRQEGFPVTEVAGVPSIDRTLVEARENVQKLRAAKQSYEKMLTQIEVINKQEGSDTVRIALVRESLTSIKSMQEAVVKRLEQLRYESKGEARITKISEARALGVPVSDNRVKYMAMTPFGVLFGLLGLFIMLELKIGRVNDLEDFSRNGSVEVFAIPTLPGPRLEPGQKGAREREGRLQEFLQTLDHLRVALCGDETATGHGRCLLITSATAGEGKTTLTAQLAACCSKAGLSTLVVDADLRRATLSRMLNEEHTPGLSDVLQGVVEIDSAPVALPEAGFHFLAAGSPGRDPSWLLQNQNLGNVLQRYRESFDLILIDTPPVLPVPDALTLGRWTDGIVLAFRYDYSRLRLVDRARKRILSAHLTVVKTVISGVPSSRFSTSGYGYGGYGYGYGGYGGYGSYGGYGDRDRRAAAEGEAAPATPTEA